jgi:periplasmic divalent cation tolerance protein
MSAVQLQFSIDDRERGDAIASALLETRLVACVQTLGPITSRYRWQGAIEEAREWLFVCKTTSDRAEAVIELVRSRHPYAVPEIVGFALDPVFGPYASWIGAETGAADDAGQH